MFAQVWLVSTNQEGILSAPYFSYFTRDKYVAWICIWMAYRLCCDDDWQRVKTSRLSFD